jgi:dephospho-CoA kinase
MNNQWNDDEKINKSHFVIVNNDLNHTEAQVVKVHEEILKRIEKV